MTHGFRIRLGVFMWFICADRMVINSIVGLYIPIKGWNDHFQYTQFRQWRTHFVGLQLQDFVNQHDLGRDFVS